MGWTLKGGLTKNCYWTWWTGASNWNDCNAILGSRWNIGGINPAVFPMFPYISSENSALSWLCLNTGPPSVHLSIITITIIIIIITITIIIIITTILIIIIKHSAINWARKTCMVRCRARCFPVQVLYTGALRLTDWEPQGQGFGCWWSSETRRVQRYPSWQTPLLIYIYTHITYVYIYTCIYIYIHIYIYTYVCMYVM